jgi:hypothetical protein
MRQAIAGRAQSDFDQPAQLLLGDRQRQRAGGTVAARNAPIGATVTGCHVSA